MARGPDIDRELLKAAMSHRLFGHSRDPVRIGRFQIVRCLGRGGTGAVYEAYDAESGGRVALKVLSAIDAPAMHRFKREFRALSGVVHPNLLRLHELFHRDGQWFFTMELVQGERFDRALHQPGQPLDEARLCAALVQLSAAVQSIHASGKLHCDIKPSNVLVSDEDRVVVLDFGLVGEQDRGDELESMSRIAGTPAYMAPEHAAGSALSPASDWYAVGVMLFETLTGRLPFEGSPLSVLRQKQQRQAPDPRVLRPELPRLFSELCNGLLQRSPEARLDGQQLAVRLAEVTPAARQPSLAAAAAPARSFVGREQELARMRRALYDVRSHRPVSLWVAGPSGIGKSALLDRFAALAASQALVLRGRCHEHETVPYKVFDGVVDALAGELRRMADERRHRLLPRQLDALLQLFPVLARVPGWARERSARESWQPERSLRDQAFAAFKELLLRLTDQGPLVILVDDLQWGDVDSARMLAHVFGPPDAPPLLFVGAYREGERQTSEFLRAALHETLPTDSISDRRFLELGPLGPEAAAALACELAYEGGALPGQGDAIADSIAQESEGVPFFIVELARRVGQQAAAGRHDPGQPPSVEALVLERVRALPDEARRLLQLFSAAGAPLEPVVATAAAGLSRGDVAPLQSLREARLIRTRGSLAEVYHDRIREIVVRAMDGSTVRALHAAIAAELERRAATDPERLLGHYRAAGELLRAGAAAVQAALVASEKLAFNRAATLFGQAIELLPAEEVRELRLHRQLGDALVDGGRAALAAEAYMTAAQQERDRSRARQLLRLAAKQYLRTDAPQRGADLARSVLHEIGIDLPRHDAAVMAMLLWERARLRATGLGRCAPAREEASETLEALGDLFPEMMGLDFTLGAVLQARHLREALRHGDPGQLLRGLVWEAYGLALLGGRANQRRAAEVMQRARVVYGEVGGPYGRALLEFGNAARSLYSGERLSDARTRAQTALDIFTSDCPSAHWERMSANYVLLLDLESMGEMKHYANLVTALQREAVEREDSYLAAVLTVATPLIPLLADEPQLSIDYLQRQERLVARSNNLRLVWWQRMALALLYAGRARQAHALVEAHWPRFRRSLLWKSEYVRANAHYLRACCATALFLETHEPRMGQRARTQISALSDGDTLVGAYRAALTGALHMASGLPDAASSALQLSCKRFRACQADLAAAYPERLLSVLTGDVTRLLAVDAELKQRGITNPQRWVAAYLPSAAGAPADTNAHRSSTA